MNDSKYVYLDNAAITLMDPRVIDVVNKHFKETYGNSMSLHSATFLTQLTKKLQNHFVKESLRGGDKYENDIRLSRCRSGL